ncbi:MAG TPA: sulfurtransferase [Burkholderiaceae bacterium]|nr:sulfurtransferase [Burkholderiaceae bacterium]
MFNLLISAAQLQDRLARPGCLVFDVRHSLADHQAGRRAYEQAHVPGALYLDHEQQLCAPRTGHNGRHPLPDLADFAALMCFQGLTSDSQVVAYDDSGGMFAAHLWWMLRWLGHPAVAVLDGGWGAWRAAGGSVESGSNSPSVSEARAVQSLGSTGQPAMPTVDAQAVLDNIQSAVFAVIDARAGDRFRGESEPMDPVAGHIPGALNRPFQQNLRPDGRFKDPGVLRTEFDAATKGLPASRIAHQCGSGITACHNLFAMELAGLRGSALYPGSWSEWCSDPSRPTATGA